MIVGDRIGVRWIGCEVGSSSPFYVWYGAFAVSMGIVLWCELGGSCLLCLDSCFSVFAKYGIDLIRKSSWSAHRFHMDGVGWVCYFLLLVWCVWEYWVDFCW